VICPVWPPKAAEIVDDPGARAVTLPEAETVATAGFELCQVALLVTFSVDPSDLRADAVMLVVEPTFTELDPVTVTEVTVTGGGDGVLGGSLPHALRAVSAAALITSPASFRATSGIFNLPANANGRGNVRVARG
jgi:hypothetical protein